MRTQRVPEKTQPSPEEIKRRVKERYAEAISGKPTGGCRGSSCCGSGDAVAARPDLVDVLHYTPEQLASLPADSVQNAFGCGNPLSFARVEVGDTVLDIGSGAGIDVLLASPMTGPSGKVIGLDFTPEMIARGRQNAQAAGATNVEFRMGDAEAMPVDDSSVDWIISNCVINLAPDKSKVFAEAFRVLRPGGRLSISDMVTGDLPPEIKENLALWSSCVSGALEEEAYLQTIRDAGFEDVRVVARQHYDAATVRDFVESGALAGTEPALVEQLLGDKGQITRLFWSAKVAARKPV